MDAMTADRAARIEKIRERETCVWCRIFYRPLAHLESCDVGFLFDEITWLKGTRRRRRNQRIGRTR